MASVKGALTKIDGVKDIDANPNSEDVTVWIDPDAGVDPDACATAVTDAGYDATTK